MKLIGLFLIGLLMVASPAFAEPGELALTGSVLLNAESQQKVDSPLVGTPLFVSITAENVGLGALAETVVNITDLTSGGGTASGNIPALAAGARVTVQIPYTFAASGCRELNIQAVLAGPATQRQLLVPVGSADACNSGIDVAAALTTRPTVGQPLIVGAPISISGTAGYTGYPTQPLGAEVTIQLIQGAMVYSYSTYTRSPDGSWAINTLYLPDQSGDYELKVSVSDGKLRGSSSQTVTVAASPGPNLRGQYLSFTGNELYQLGSKRYAPVNADVQLSAAFQNSGGTTASGNVKVQFYLDEQEPTPDTLLCEQVVSINLAGVSFASGYPVYSSKSVVCPTTWKPATTGVKNVYVLIDTDNAISETHENDNQLSSYIETRARKPDLRLGGHTNQLFFSDETGVYEPVKISFYTEPGVGETVKISGDIYNVGTADLSPSTFKVDFYDGFPVVGDTNLIGSSIITAGITKGQKTIASIDWDTSAAVAGIHNIWVVVDADGAIDEDFESENLVKGGILDVLDTNENLQILAIGPDYAVAGSPGTITAKLKNRSVVPVTNSQINFYLGDPLSSGTLLGSVQSGALARGGKKDISLPWTPASTGTAYIYVRIEASGRKKYQAVSVYPTPPPDVEVVSSGITISGSDSTRTLNSSATISAIISEKAGAATGTFSVSFTAEGPELVNLGTRRVSLGSKASTVVTAPVPLKFNYRNYLVRVAVTDLSDGDFSNNIATQAAEANGGYPVANAGGDLSAWSGALVTLGTTASVGPGFQWVLTQQPPDSLDSLINATSRQASFYPHSSGVYIAELHATNGVEHSYDSVVINVSHLCPNVKIYQPTSSGNGSFELAWSTSPVSPVIYVIEESTNGGTSWNAFRSQSTNILSVTGKANGNYMYRVKTTKSGYTDSAWVMSSPINVTLTCPTVGQIYQPTTSSLSSFNIGWGASPASPVTYVIEENINGAGWNAYATQASNLLNIIDKPNGSYMYRVKVQKSGYAESAWITSQPITVALTCPTVSQINQPTSSPDGTIAMGWTASSLAPVTYVIEESTNGGTSWSAYATQASNLLNITGKAAGSYMYRVKVQKGGYAESGWKTSQPITVALTCPTVYINQPTTISDGTIAMGWNYRAITGATFVIEESTNGGANWNAYTSQASNLLTITGKTNGSYLYRVKTTKPSYADSAWTTSKPIVVTLTTGMPGQVYIPTTTKPTFTIGWNHSRQTPVTYVIEESFNAGAYTALTSQASNLLNLTGKPVGQYTYRIKAQKGGWADSGWRTSGVITVVP